MTFLTILHWYHRIRNRSNDLSFEKCYFCPSHNKTIMKKINTQMVFEIYVVYCWIFYCRYIFLPCFVWLRIIEYENNIYTSCVNSTEPFVEPNFLHQLHMHANTVLYVIINLMYLHLPYFQWLFIYIIPQYWTHIVWCLLANLW